LRPDMRGHAGPAHFPAVSVHFAIAEHEDHRGSTRGR
jgi:hypothetical protein